jgi:hypothetical protein
VSKTTFLLPGQKKEEEEENIIIKNDAIEVVNHFKQACTFPPKMYTVLRPAEMKRLLFLPNLILA